MGGHPKIGPARIRVPIQHDSSASSDAIIQIGGFGYFGEAKTVKIPFARVLVKKSKGWCLDTTKLICGQEHILSGHFHFLIIQNANSDHLDALCINHADLARNGKDLVVTKSESERCRKDTDSHKLYSFVLAGASRVGECFSSLMCTQTLPPKAKQGEDTDRLPARETVNRSWRRHTTNDLARWLVGHIRRYFCEKGSSVCFHVDPPSFYGLHSSTYIVIAPWKWAEDEQHIFRHSGRQPVLSLGEELMSGGSCTIIRLFLSEARQVIKDNKIRGEFKSPLSFTKFMTSNHPQGPRFLVLGCPTLSKSEQTSETPNCIAFILLLDEYFHATRGSETLDFSKKRLKDLNDHQGDGSPFLIHDSINVERHQMRFSTMCDTLLRITNEGAKLRIPCPQSRLQNPVFSTADLHVPITDFLQHLYDTRDWEDPKMLSLTDEQYDDIRRWQHDSCTIAQQLDLLREKHGLRFLHADLAKALDSKQKSKQPNESNDAPAPPILTDPANVWRPNTSIAGEQDPQNQEIARKENARNDIEETLSQEITGRSRSKIVDQHNEPITPRKVTGPKMSRVLTASTKVNANQGTVARLEAEDHSRLSKSAQLGRDLIDKYASPRKSGLKGQSIMEKCGSCTRKGLKCEREDSSDSCIWCTKNENRCRPCTEDDLIALRAVNENRRKRKLAKKAREHEDLELDVE